MVHMAVNSSVAVLAVASVAWFDRRCCSVVGSVGVVAGCRVTGLDTDAVYAWSQTEAVVQVVCIYQTDEQQQEQRMPHFCNVYSTKLSLLSPKCYINGCGSGDQRYTHTAHSRLFTSSTFNPSSQWKLVSRGKHRTLSTTGCLHIEYSNSTHSLLLAIDSK